MTLPQINQHLEHQIEMLEISPQFMQVLPRVLQNRLIPGNSISMLRALKNIREALQAPAEQMTEEEQSHWQAALDDIELMIQAVK